VIIADFLVYRNVAYRLNSYHFPHRQVCRNLRSTLAIGLGSYGGGASDR